MKTCRRGHPRNSEHSYIGRDGYPVCRTCRRENQRPSRERRDLRHRYGISTGEYAAMLARQGHRCANPGCRVEFSDQVRSCVDHDHSTKKVRGLLCHRCNTALGYARESLDVLIGLADYLEAQTSAEAA